MYLFLLFSICNTAELKKAWSIVMLAFPVAFPVVFQANVSIDRRARSLKPSCPLPWFKTFWNNSFTKENKSDQSILKGIFQVRVITWMPRRSFDRWCFLPLCWSYRIWLYFLAVRVLMSKCVFAKRSCLLYLGCNHPNPFSSQTISKILGTI